ncbi:hypothetical protein EAE99_007921 [Botrytis elliptica]|nr:hypothetical protein EAE99_007921 [Botrytis elliptica]
MPGAFTSNTNDKESLSFATYRPRFPYAHTLASYRLKLSAPLGMRAGRELKAGHTMDGVRCKIEARGLESWLVEMQGIVHTKKAREKPLSASLQCKSASQKVEKCTDASTKEVHIYFYCITRQGS